MPRSHMAGAVPCRSCGRYIVYCRTEAGALMPVDEGAAVVYRIVEDDGALAGTPKVERVAAEEAVHISHFASCPNAAAWRTTGRPA